MSTSSLQTVKNGTHFLCASFLPEKTKYVCLYKSHYNKLGPTGA